MIKVGVIGATGYAGINLVRILLHHPEVKVTWVNSEEADKGKKLSDIYPYLKDLTDLTCQPPEIGGLIDKVDLVFIALPHGMSQNIVPQIAAKGKKIIDFGGDFRFDDPKIYKKWYGLEHKGKELPEPAVYGLPEINREKIKKANIIANPGCYVTASILALAPLLKEKAIDVKSIIVDAKSGVSGGGRGLNPGLHFAEANENFSAYKVAAHRHMPEIEQELSKLAGGSVQITFTPHLTPMSRGILATVYANLTKNLSLEKIVSLFSKFYQNEYFVRVYPKGQLPKTKYIAGTNFCDLGIALDEHTNRVIVLSAVDNLVKGAAGQAVQNMNLMYGWDEKLGLDAPAVYP